MSDLLVSSLRLLFDNYATLYAIVAFQTWLSLSLRSRSDPSCGRSDVFGIRWRRQGILSRVLIKFWAFGYNTLGAFVAYFSALASVCWVLIVSRNAWWLFIAVYDWLISVSTTTALLGVDLWLFNGLFNGHGLVVHVICVAIVWVGQSKFENIFC